MLRVLRLFSHSNTCRYAQFLPRRLCSGKSDDSSPPVKDPENATDKSKASSASKHRRINSKYRRYEKTSSFPDLLESLPLNPRYISLEILIDFYENMKGNYLIRPEDLQHQKFEVLRKATEMLLPEMNTKELKNILIAILPSKAIMHDRLTKQIVEAMVKRVTYLPFDQVLFVDFMIQKYYNTSELSKDYIILKSKLQTMFLSKNEDELDEYTDLEDFMKVVAYCENNHEIIPSKIVNRLTTSLLLMDDKEFAVKDITSVLIFLANLGKLDEHVEKLLRKMFVLWAQSDVTANHVDVLFRVLAVKSHTFDKERFKDSEFVRICVNSVTQQKDEKILFSVQNSFNKLGFASKNLIEHISMYFESKGMRELNVHDYIVLCTACSKANYTPPNWETILQKLKSFKFSYYLSNFGQFDWLQFAIDLDKLGHCDIDLIQKLINSKYMQSKKFYDPSKIEHLKKILERENVSHSETGDESDSQTSDSKHMDGGPSFHDDLKRMIGASKIWTKLQIDSKLTLPYVLKIDLESGDFLPILKEPNAKDTTDNELLIGVILTTGDHDRDDRKKINSAKSKARQIGKKGISVIILGENKWNRLKTYEKSSVFYTKVLNKTENHRRRLLNERKKRY